jgi:hypothetical protein
MSVVLFNYFTPTGEDRQVLLRVQARLRERGFTCLNLIYSATEADYAEFENVVKVPWGVRFELSVDIAPSDIQIPQDIIDEAQSREVSWSRPNVPVPSLDGVARFSAHFCQSLFDALKGHDVVEAVVWNGHYSNQVLLNYVLNALRVPISYIERGPFPALFHWDRMGMLRASSIGQMSGAEFTSKEASLDSKWIERFNLIADKFLDGETAWHPQPGQMDQATAREILGIPEDAMVIFFAGQVDADTQNFLFNPHFESCGDALSWTLKQFGQRNDVFFFGKHHPKSHHPKSHYQQLMGDPKRWVDSIPIDVCLELADRVVAVNSTVAFEALLKGIPTLTLGEHMATGKGVFYEFSGLDSATAVFDLWLEASDFKRMQENYRSLMGLYLEQCGYARTAFAEDAGLRNAEALADDLLSTHESEGRVALNLYNFRTAMAVPEIEKSWARKLVAEQKNRFLNRLKRLVKRLIRIAR